MIQRMGIEHEKAQENTEGDSAEAAGQAIEAEATTNDNHTEEAVVEAVVPHWRRPHRRLRIGPLTGYRP